MCHLAHNLPISLSFRYKIGAKISKMLESYKNFSLFVSKKQNYYHFVRFLLEINDFLLTPCMQIRGLLSKVLFDGKSLRIGDKAIVLAMI